MNTVVPIRHCCKSGRCWNILHGETPEEVLSDHEGIRNLKMMACNMAWMLKTKEAARLAGVKEPDYLKYL